MSGEMLLNKTIPCDSSWDVIVAGGGPAGCAAAAASAREGARTLLIETTGALGGMGTNGLVPSWAPFSDKEKVIYRGIAQKVFEECKSALPHVSREQTDWVPIDPEALKRVYDDLVVESGAKILFNTFICSAETDGKGVVSSVVTANKSGLKAYGAKVFIDCTGDADLAAWAGADFIKGGDETGELQWATHCFMLTNVDEYAYLNGPNLHSSHAESPIYDILQSGEFPEIIDAHLCHSLLGPRVVGLNAGHIPDVDNTDPESVSSALIKGRKIAAAFHQALAKFHPKAFAGSFLAATGTLMGVRETRRVIGDYTLTVDDYLGRKSFDDEICRCCYYIDIHGAGLTGADVPAMKYPRYSAGESFGIPYRCLTPKGLKNVLVAGRSISSTRPLQGSIRVMPVCLATGEAAGVSAAMSAGLPCVDLHKLDPANLREKLRENGVYLP